MRRRENVFKAGWYDFDNGKRYYMRSGFEARWGYYLDFLVRAREVLEWRYEQDSFEISANRNNIKTYTPDFLVKYKKIPTSRNWYKSYYHETKGQITQKDVTKFRKMSKEHPRIKIILVMQRIPQGKSKSAVRQRALIDKARKYVERIIEAEPILKKVGL